MTSFRSHWRLLLTFGALLTSSNGQVGQVIHAGEEIFVVTVRGAAGLEFRGSYLVAAVGTQESKKGALEGSVPAEFKFQGSAVFVNIQKRHSEGQLDVEISRNGVSLKRQSSDAPYAVVGLASQPPAPGPPRQTTYRVDGSVHFASLTMTSETGDTEQRLVPLPFEKTFFPRADWIVSLLAQKTRVTKPDPLSRRGDIGPR